MADTTTTPAAPAVDPAERRALAATILAGLCAKYEGETEAHFTQLAARALRAADAMIAESAPKK